jgi:hypothetical protein
VHPRALQKNGRKKNGDMHGRRGKKNILLPAGEMGCVAGEGKKKFIAGEIAACRRGKKIIKIRNKKIVEWQECTGMAACQRTVQCPYFQNLKIWQEFYFF